MSTQNKNLLQPTKYSLVFPEISDTIYFCQKANLPGVQLDYVSHQTPQLDLYVSGTKLSYNTFDITFLVNEDLVAWTSIYNWMKELASVDQSYKRRQPGIKQAILTVYSNQNNPKFRIKYSNIFPLSVSDLEFDTTLSAEDHVVATATFRYDYFEIEKL